MSDLARAVALLTGEHTCILCAGELLLTSQKRGIVPLLELYEEGRLKNAALADKIIGKAAALLLILGRAKAVHGQVMSESAYALLTRAGMTVTYGELVPYIINRRGDGMCPMEEAVAALSSPEDAPAALRAALARLKSSTAVF